VQAPAMVLALGELLVIFAKEKIENACSGLSLGFLECLSKASITLGTSGHILCVDRVGGWRCVAR